MRRGRNALPLTTNGCSSRRPEDGGVGEKPDGQAGQPQGPDVLVAVGKMLVRLGLVRWLEGSGMVGRVRHAAHGRDAVARLRERPFDILMVDPGLAGAPELAGSLADADVRKLLVTSRTHAGETAQCGQSQACGLLSESQDEAGAEALLGAMCQCWSTGARPDDCSQCPLRGTLGRARLPLSPRESEVFLRIGQGLGPKRIAADLGLSVKTVESYRETIKQKLGLDSADALLWTSMRWREGYPLSTD